MYSQKARLQQLKDSGFSPNGILDIGAHTGTWTEMISKVFPESPFLMVEGNTDHEPVLQKIKAGNTNINYEISLLSDSSKEVTYFKKKEGGTSGNSLYRENTASYVDDNIIREKRRTRTLDSLIKEKNFSADLIKLDVQGSECDIIQSGEETLKNVRFLILETQIMEYNQHAPLANDVIQFLNQKGFRIADIIELHYLPDGRLCEIDVLFAKENDPIFHLNKSEKIVRTNDSSDKYSILLNSMPAKKLIKKILKLNLLGKS